MNKPWDDPEEKLNKKLRKIGRSASYAMGGAIGLWIIKLFFPKESGHDKITNIIGDIIPVLFVYGAVLLAALIFKKKLAPIISSTMTWLIVPGWLAYIFMNASGF